MVVLIIMTICHVILACTSRNARSVAEQSSMNKLVKQCSLMSAAIDKNNIHYRLLLLASLSKANSEFLRLIMDLLHNRLDNTPMYFLS